MKDYLKFMGIVGAFMALAFGLLWLGQHLQNLFMKIYDSGHILLAWVVLMFICLSVLYLVYGVLFKLLK